MMTRIKKWLAPPVYNNEKETRAAYLLNVISISYLVVISILTVLGLLEGGVTNITGATFVELANRVLPMFLAFAVAQFLMRRGRIKTAAYAYIILMWLNYVWGIWLYGGIQASTLSNFILAVLVAGLLISNRGAMLTAGSSIFAIFLTLVVQDQGLISSREIAPIERFIAVTLNLSLSAVYLSLYIRSLDEALNAAKTANDQLEEARGTLEIRVAERTQDLELAAEIGQNISRIRDLNRLTTTAVSLIRQRFGLYHVQLYLSDAMQTRLTLFSSTGEAGSQLLAEGHTLPIGFSSINGRAAAEKKPVIVSDTPTSDMHLPNPLLPDTRSETAVPLLVGDKVVGVLDLQSSQPSAFTEDNLPAFSTLAGQLAIAVENSTLFAEQERLAAELQHNADLLEKFKLGMERSSDAIFLTDREGHITYVNDAFTNIYGFTREETLGATPNLLKSGVIPQEQYQYFWQTLLSGGIVAGEIVNKTKDGRLINIEGSNNPIIDESGQIIGFLAMHKDITKRKHIEEANHQQEELMRTIINATPDWIFIKDTEHRYQLVNQSYANTMKLAPEAFIGKNDIEIGFPEDIVKGNAEKGIRGFWADDQEIMANGEMKIIAEEPAVVDGEPRVLSTVKVPLKNSEGRAIGVVGFVHDITAAKTAEMTMAKQAQDLQTVADLSTAVSKTLDTEQLLQEVVDRTKESFNLYHAHIYLLDEANGVLKLAAGAGEVGAQMVAVGYSIPADHPHSLVAQAAQSKQGVIVNNVAADPAFLPNPLLPNTKSEMAVPMIVANKVIGVLDIQADTVDHFTHTDVNIQTTLAAQTAVALENARAFEQARQSTIIIDNTTNLIATMSLEQKILSLNNAGLRRLGYESLADVQGQSVSILFPKDGAEEHRTPAMMALQQQGFWRGESMLITKSGERFPVEQVISMIRDENGIPQMIVFNMTDITEQKEAEQAQQALTAELEEQLERVNALQRAMTREGWQAYMTASKRPFQGFEFNQDGVKALIARDLVGGQNGKSQKARTNGANQVVNPVKIHGATIGQIGARNANGEPLSDVQREMLAALTNQVAEALERARLSEQTQIALTETEHREQELAVLNAMAQSLTAQTTVDGVLAVIHEYTERLMASDEFYVAFFTAATNEIVFAYAVTEGRIIRNYGRRQAGKGLTEHVLAQRQPILIASDIDQYLHEIGIEAIGRQAASWMGCPLQYGDQVIGLLSLQSYHTPYAYNQQDLRLLSAIANQAAIAIENARLIEATDKRARQEQLLREVSAKVGAAVDAESVLQTAAREIGRALGLETFIYLKKGGGDQPPSKTAVPQPSPHPKTETAAGDRE